MRFRFVFFLLLLFQTALGGSSELDSLLRQDDVLQGEDKVLNLIRIARYYVVQDDTLSVSWAKKALRQAESMGFTVGVGKAAFFTGVGYDEVNMDSATRYYTMARGIFEPMQHAWLSFCYTNLARIYREKGWYSQALDYGIRATKWFENAGDSAQLAIELSNMGYTYDRMGDYTLDIAYQKQALAIAGDHGDDYILGMIFGRIGIAHDELVQYDSAHYFNQKALYHYRQVDDKDPIMQTLSNIGNTLLKENRLEESEATLKEALAIDGTDYNKTILLVNLGNVYYRSGRYGEALSLLDRAISKAIEHQQTVFLSEAYYLKHKVYETLGRPRDALHFYSLYHELSDSLLNVEKTKQVAEMRIRFETEEKEKELLRQKAEKEKIAREKAQTEIMVYNRNKWIVGISSLSLIGLFFGLFVVQRTKRKTQAEKDAAIIKERERGLDAVLEAQENERRRIARDLHDGIGQQLSGLKMAWQNLQNELGGANPEQHRKLTELTSILDEAASEARTISHQMMPRILGESGLVPAIEDLLGKSLGAAGMAYDFETFQVEGRFAQKIEVSIYRVLQELINNIIKHSEARMVNVQLLTNRGYLILIVEDNGKGMASDEDGEGHGILNIKSRINAIKGEVSYDPSPGSGTVATVRVPVPDQAGHSKRS